MDSQILYNINHQEAFGIFIAVYFYLTGLSEGSFLLSTLAYSFGLEKYKSLGRVGIILATVLLIIAPVFLLLHIGVPQRAWHLLVYLNFESPITWGSFLLIFFLITCILYGFFIFREQKKVTRFVGFIGIPLAISVNVYTGFILAFGKARALWNTALMPILFLVSAIISGIALMILACFMKDRFFSKQKKVDYPLLENLGKMLAWLIVIDLFLVGCDILVLLISHSDAQGAARLLLSGNFSFLFLIVENLLGKIVPFTLLIIPRFRNKTTIIIASLLVLIGTFFMKYIIVAGGEFIPLI